MKKLLVLAGLMSLALGAQAAPPTPQSLDRLLDLTQSHKLIDNVVNQIDQMVRTSSAQLVMARHLSAADQAALDRELDEITAKVRQDLAWERLRTVFVKVYAETFTQDEVDGMIAFYQSPAGKAFVEKTPLVMQRSMQLMRPQFMEDLRSARSRLQAFADHLPAQPAAKSPAKPS